MGPEIADTPSPDAVLMAACGAAQAAIEAYDAEARKAKSGKRLSTLGEKERLASESVAAARAYTPRGIAEKALLLEASEGRPAAVSLALSLASDAVALVREMVGAPKS